jgi:hypothetical protein
VPFVDVVKEDDPTNNVPDTIFSKIGLQLHRRDNHPLGILKNTIYDYFDKNFGGQFDKFDDLCPLVSVKQVWVGSCLLYFEWCSYSVFCYRSTAIVV